MILVIFCGGDFVVLDDDLMVVICRFIWVDQFNCRCVDIVYVVIVCDDFKGFVQFIWIDQFIWCVCYYYNFFFVSCWVRRFCCLYCQYNQCCCVIGFWRERRGWVKVVVCCQFGVFCSIWVVSIWVLIGGIFDFVIEVVLQSLVDYVVWEVECVKCVGVQSCMDDVSIILVNIVCNNQMVVVCRCQCVNFSRVVCFVVFVCGRDGDRVVSCFECCNEVVCQIFIIVVVGIGDCDFFDVFFYQNFGYYNILMCVRWGCVEEQVVVFIVVVGQIWGCCGWRDYDNVVGQCYVVQDCVGYIGIVSVYDIFNVISCDQMFCCCGCCICVNIGGVSMYGFNSCIVQQSVVFVDFGYCQFSISCYMWGQ